MERQDASGVGDPGAGRNDDGARIPKSYDPVSGLQRNIWSNGIGDDWLSRNQHALGIIDMVTPLIEKIGEKPLRILEIGCASGWRLKALKEKFNCEVWGIDPSENSIAAAEKEGLSVKRATADKLPFNDGSFDYVIFGFCLCFISPEDWPALVHESDRVLVHGGHLIINDFSTAGYSKRVMQWVKSNEYDDLIPNHLYYFPWKNLWLAHPMYQQTHEIFNMDKAEMVVSLKKDLAGLIRGEVK